MRFTIDTSVFISRLSETEKAHEASRRFLQALPGRPVLVVLPTLIAPEISGAMRRLTGSSTVARDSLRLLDLVPNLNLITVDEQLAAEAATIAAEGGMRGSDAVFVAIAQRFDAVLVSLDRTQLQRGPRTVKALSPDDALEELESIH
jgi:predicted nucleic acid-binding protein